MKPPVKIAADVGVTDQPTEAELKALSGQGYRSVINLRREGEANQPMSPAEEGEKARAAGLGYGHVPVNSATLSDKEVQEFGKLMDSLPGPVLVHCAAGQRAAALAIVHLAKKDGRTAEEALNHVRDAGQPISDATLAGFVNAQLPAKR